VSSGGCRPRLTRKGEYSTVVYVLSIKAKLALEVSRAARRHTPLPVCPRAHPAQEGRFLHYRDLSRRMAESQHTLNRIMRADKATRKKAGGDFWDAALTEKLAHDERSRVEKYFFDLNAVEAILLGSIIIIALSGIMFESGRFTTRPDLLWTGQMTTVLVFILLFGTLFYYLLVFINELFPMCFARYCGRAMLRYQSPMKKSELEALDAELVLDANPLFTSTQSKPVGDRSAVLEKELQQAAQALSKARQQNADLYRQARSRGETGE
jgi:hypothetical protein